MEEFTVSPPNTLLYLLGGIVVIGAISVLLKRGDTRKKITSLAVVVVISVLLAFWLYRPIRIAVGEDGLSVTGRMSLDLSWSQVDSALYEPSLPASEWRPSVRQFGAAIGSYRTGRFLLSNGRQAQLAMERSDATVILRVGDSTYLFAPQDVDGLAQAINRYRTIGGSAND